MTFAKMVGQRIKQFPTRFSIIYLVKGRIVLDKLSRPVILQNAVKSTKKSGN